MDIILKKNNKKVKVYFVTNYVGLKNISALLENYF